MCQMTSWYQEKLTTRPWRVFIRNDVVRPFAGCLDSLPRLSSMRVLNAEPTVSLKLSHRILFQRASRRLPSGVAVCLGRTEHSMGSTEGVLVTEFTDGLRWHLVHGASACCAPLDMHWLRITPGRKCRLGCFQGRRTFSRAGRLRRHTLQVGANRLPFTASPSLVWTLKSTSWMRPS